MKKEILKRVLIGSFVGIAIGQIISVIISLCLGTGEFVVCAPQFTESVGNEAAAGAVQTLLCAVIGAGFAGASVTWESEKLSFAAQTGICFGIYAVIMLPLAYFSYWIEHTAAGFLSYLAIFIGAFIVMWIGQYFSWKKKIRDINEKIKM